MTDVPTPVGIPTLSAHARRLPASGESPEPARQRAAFLIEAGRLLATSLDLDATLQQVAALAVPALADVCMVELVDDGASAREPVAIAVADPDRLELAHAFRRQFPLDVVTPSGVGRVVRSGVAELIPEITDEMLVALARDDEHLRVTRGLGVRSAMAVPIRARGRVFGAISFYADAASGTRFGSDDLETAQQLADRAALALDSARLHAAEIKARHRAERAVARLRGLHELVVRLSTTTTAADVAHTVVDASTRMFGAITVGMWVVEPDGRLGLLASAGYPDDASFSKLPLRDDFPLGDAILGAGAIWLDDWAAYARKYPGSSERSAARRPDDDRAIACLPLVVDGQAIGGVALTFPASEPPNDDDRTVVATLAHHAAHGFARARLFERERSAVERLEAVFAASPTAIVLVDDAMRVGMWNAAAEKMFGWSADDAVGTVFPIASPDQLATLHRHLQGLRPGQTVEPWEARRHTREGDELDVESRYAPVLLPDGREQYIGVILDVSARKRAEQRLRRSEEVSRFLAAASSALAASLDLDATLDRVAALAVPVLGDSCRVDLVREDAAWEGALADIDPVRLHRLHTLRRRWPPGPDHLSARVARTGESRLVREIGEAELLRMAHDDDHLAALRACGFRSVVAVPMVVRGAAIGTISVYRQDGSPPHEVEDVAVVEDFARRVALHVENVRLYQQAQHAIARRDDFLSVASHELKTPIAALRLLVQGAIRQLARPGEVVDHDRLLDRLQRTDSQVGRLLRLVHDLLDVSRIGAARLDLRPSIVDLGRLVADVLARFEVEAGDSGTELRLAVDGPVLGTWDADRLDQVVTNLVGNALKFGAGHPVTITLHGGAAAVELDVRDEGPGIAPEDHDRIFRQFERTADAAGIGGFGLGLWIAHEIVAAHGGTMTVRSALGAGATFVVRLPVTTSGEPPDEGRG